MHKTSALDDLKEECIRRGLWRAEGNHIRRGPFPPPAPEVSIRELSVEEEQSGYAYLKIEPLNAPAVAFETGDATPTPSSSPVPTPTRFEATGLRYRFIAFDPNDLIRISQVKEWTAKLRLRYQLHNRGDHYEVELLALPRANGITIRYTTDGSSPTSAGSATYSGPVRVPSGCRIVCAVAVAESIGVNSETVRVAIPQKGEEERRLNPGIPAKWNLQTKLDDSGSVWDFIGRMEKAPQVVAFDINLTAESSDGLQVIDYSGAVDGGYDAVRINAVAERLQEIVGGGSIRMSVGNLSFPTGQALLDWLKALNIPFDLTKATQ